MAEKARQLHDEWLALDSLARDAEKQLAAEWSAYFSEGAAPPADKTVELVKLLREEAGAKLNELMEYMAQTARKHM